MTHARRVARRLATCAIAAAVATPAAVAAQSDYRVLATNKTSSMLKEMQEAAEAGYQFVCVMGGETSFGGNEVVVIMGKAADAVPRFEYRLLATSKTSTMQKEIKEAADQGYQVVGMAVGETMVGGRELVTIMRRPRS